MVVSWGRLRGGTWLVYCMRGQPNSSTASCVLHGGTGLVYSVRGHPNSSTASCVLIMVLKVLSLMLDAGSKDSSMCVMVLMEWRCLYLCRNDIICHSYLDALKVSVCLQANQICYAVLCIFSYVAAGMDNRQPQIYLMTRHRGHSSHPNRGHSGHPTPASSISITVTGSKTL